MDDIKRKGDKIGMRCSTCFKHNFLIANVVTFLESTTKSLLGRLVCLSQTLLLCRIVSLVHTQLLLTVTVHCYSAADFHSGGVGSLGTMQWCPNKST